MLVAPLMNSGWVVDGQLCTFAVHPPQLWIVTQWVIMLGALQVGGAVGLGRLRILSMSCGQ